MSQETSVQYLEPNFTESEMQRLTVLYHDIVKSHAVCGGDGIVLLNGEAGPCRCETVYRYLRRLVFARIPVAHWRADRLWPKAAVRAGVTLGAIQTGKTSLLAATGINGLRDNQQVHYVTAADLLQHKRESDDSRESAILLERALGASILLIDDLTTAPKTEWSQTYIESVARGFADRAAILMVAVDNAHDAFRNWEAKCTRLVSILGDARELPGIKNHDRARATGHGADDWARYLDGQEGDWQAPEV